GGWCFVCPHDYQARRTNMSAPTQTVPARTMSLNARELWKAIRREGSSLILVIILGIVIIGPMLTVIFWAFANVWRFPSLVPTQWGLKFWMDTITRADVTSAFPLSIFLSVAVTFLSAVICLPA